MLNATRWNRLAPFALAAGLSLPLSGCFGRFGLTNTVYEWNKSGVSQSPITQEVLFLGLLIIPVYEVALVVDAIVLNPIELITGNNPMSAKQMNAESQVIALSDGATLTLTYSQRGVAFTHEVDGEVRSHLIRQGEMGLEMYDNDGLLEAGTQRTTDGGLIIVDGDGRVLSQHSGVMLALLDQAIGAQDATAASTLLVMESDGVCALD